MSSQRQMVANQSFNFVPTTLREAQEYATIFASSGLCPEGYRNKPNDILIVWQMGKELGLEKMQALRTLGCINGMPFAYGDGLLALVKRHPLFEDMKEWCEGSLEKGTLTAFCTFVRKGNAPVTKSFSISDAKTALLWSKKGPWTQYPQRMLQHRARGFAAKDAFPDALFGLMSEDEARGVAESKLVVEAVKTTGRGMSSLEDALEISEHGEVLNGEFTKTDTEESPLDQLKRLIVESKIPEKALNVWLKKANVTTIDELSPELIEKGITFLKNKEIKDEIHT